MGNWTGYILNCVPSRNTDKDWGLRAAASARVYDSSASIPGDFDLRESWWKIGQQGSTGSCVGWGSADGVFFWHFRKAKLITEDQRLSVRYVWMAAKETDEFTDRPTTFIERDGTSLKAALDVARNYGLVTEDILPFQFRAGEPLLYADGEADDFFAFAAQLKIRSYFSLGTNTVEWRRWIATKGPLLARLVVDSNWDQATETKGRLHVYDKGTARGGHCVAIVGYTRDYFIVRNSWGEEFGDHGFAYADDAYVKEAFTEAYGISV